MKVLIMMSMATLVFLLLVGYRDINQLVIGVLASAVGCGAAWYWSTTHKDVDGT